MNELKKNCLFIMNKSHEECFIEKLYERNIFDTNMFNDLIKNIMQEIKNRKNRDKQCFTKNLILQWQLSEIFKILLCSLHSYYNPMCINRMTDFNPIYYTYSSRLEFLIKCFVFNDYRAVLEYEDELGKLI